MVAMHDLKVPPHLRQSICTSPIHLSFLFLFQSIFYNLLGLVQIVQTKI